MDKYIYVLEYTGYKWQYHYSKVKYELNKILW